MRQNVLHWCQMVRVRKPIEHFGCSFWCLYQDFAWPYPCKAKGVETPSWQRAPLRSGLGGYLNLHCCMTLSQHHEFSRHQSCDTIKGITSLTPFRHHFFDAIEASFLWHHCGITYLTPLRHHYDTIKKSFLWHHCGITYLTPQRYHYDSIKASFLWHHWGITSLTPLRHHCDTIKAPFLWHHCGITSLAPQSIMTPLRHHFCDTIEASLLWHHWGITITSIKHHFFSEAEATS